MSILPYGNNNNIFYIDKINRRIEEFESEIDNNNYLKAKLIEKQKKYIFRIKNPKQVFIEKRKKYLGVKEKICSIDKEYNKKLQQIENLHAIIDLSQHRNLVIPGIFDKRVQSKRQDYLDNTERMIRIEVKSIEKNIDKLGYKLDKYHIYSNEEHDEEILKVIENYYENKLSNLAKSINKQNKVIEIYNEEYKIYKEIKSNLLYVNEYKSILKILTKFFPNLNIVHFGFFDLFMYINLFYVIEIFLQKRYEIIFNELIKIFNLDIVEKILNTYKEKNIDNYIFKIDFKQDNNSNVKYNFDFDYEYMFRYYNSDKNEIYTEIDDEIKLYFNNEDDIIKNRIKNLIIFIIWLNYSINPFYNPKCFLLDINSDINYLNFIRIIENIDKVNIFNKDVDEELVFNYLKMKISSENKDDKNDNSYHKYNFGLNISSDLICFFEYNLD